MKIIKLIMCLGFIGFAQQQTNAIPLIENEIKLDNRNIASVISDNSTIISKYTPLAENEEVVFLDLYDPISGTMKPKHISTLSNEQIRKMILINKGVVSVEKRDTNGNFEYLGNVAEIGRGYYRVTYDNTYYTTKNVQMQTINGLKTVKAKIGLGLIITAEIESKSKNLKVQNLLPIAAGYSDKKVSGKLEFKMYGISNSQYPISIPGSLDLTEDNINEALKKVAEATVLVHLKDTTLQPYIIAIAEY